MGSEGLLARVVHLLDRMCKAATCGSNFRYFALAFGCRCFDRAEIVLARVGNMRERVAIVVLHELDDVVSVKLADVASGIHDADDIVLTRVLLIGRAHAPRGCAGLCGLFVEAHLRARRPVEIRIGFAFVLCGRRTAECQDQNESQEN